MVLKIEALGGRGRHLFLKVQRRAAGLWRQRAGSRRLRGAVLASSTPDGEVSTGQVSTQDRCPAGRPTLSSFYSQRDLGK